MELSFLTILNWVTTRLHSFYLHCTSLHETRAKTRVAAQNSSGGSGGYRLSKKEVELVMARIGLSCSGLMEEEMGGEDISAMFAEEEPCMEEVREAFAVFDANGDGFIDAWELQGVLCRLGFSEGVELEKCEEMIISAHGGGDHEKMELDGFVGLMEKSFIC